MAARPFRMLELCAGTGMLGVGVEVALPGARTVCHVEREAYSAAILAARMEAAEQAEFLCARVRELEGDLTDDDDVSRQYFGHVIPALARMEAALAPHPERRSE